VAPRTPTLAARDETLNYGSTRSIRADALPCPEGQTLALAATATRLKRLDAVLHERLINCGYAVCDAAMRKHAVSGASQGAFPLGESWDRSTDSTSAAPTRCDGTNDRVAASRLHSPIRRMTAGTADTAATYALGVQHGHIGLPHLDGRLRLGRRDGSRLHQSRSVWSASAVITSANGSSSWRSTVVRKLCRVDEDPIVPLRAPASPCLTPPAA
jgi:hypothetical protein